MLYYKLLWDDSPTITDIPGFVWPNRETAIANYDEFCDWTYGPTNEPHIYEIDGPDPIQFPLCFAGRLCFNPKRNPPQKLSNPQQAFDYFSTKPTDFFSTAQATEDDVLLFLNLAATVGAFRSAPNPKLDEYFVGIPCKMQNISGSSGIRTH
jgi:hypothetical protein